MKPLFAVKDIKKLALSVLVRKVTSQLGFVNVKPQQLEAILARMSSCLFLLGLGRC